MRVLHPIGFLRTAILIPTGAHIYDKHLTSQHGAQPNLMSNKLTQD